MRGGNCRRSGTRCRLLRSLMVQSVSKELIDESEYRQQKESVHYLFFATTGRNLMLVPYLVEESLAILLTTSAAP